MRNLIVTICVTLIFISCNFANSSTMKSNEIFPKGEKVTENFVGEAWVVMLSNDVDNFDVMAPNVIFAPKSRNFWHAHPGGQLLFGTSGEGYYQEKGKPIQLLKVGDVVEVKPNVIHWHGATPKSEFVHLGISPQVRKGATNWYGPVTDEEYNSFGE